MKDTINFALLGILITGASFAGNGAQPEKMIVNDMNNPIEVTLTLSDKSIIWIEIPAQSTKKVVLPPQNKIMSAWVHEPAAFINKDWTFSADPSAKGSSTEYKEKYEALLNYPVSVFTHDRTPGRKRAFRLWTMEQLRDRQSLSELPGAIFSAVVDFLKQSGQIAAGIAGFRR